MKKKAECKGGPVGPAFGFVFYVPLGILLRRPTFKQAKIGLETKVSKDFLLPKPSEAGSVGRGGAREQTQFSPSAETKFSGLCDDESG